MKRITILININLLYFYLTDLLYYNSILIHQLKQSTAET
uniref:Uncharacterized protein n=1 Tax=Polysiphonia sp. TaxID=1967842 RepID=A0A1Z1MT67_9FLOR|nr:hypothetical protein [Polysiphonia sp.]